MEGGGGAEGDISLSDHGSVSLCPLQLISFCIDYSLSGQCSCHIINCDLLP